MKPIRTFIAIKLNNDIRHALINIQKDLQTADANVKWVEPQNIHLTLKFLSDTDPSLLNAIKATLDKITRTTPAFDITLSNLGAFPDLTRPEIIWAEITNGALPLMHIFNKLEQELDFLGFKKEGRAFSAHVTLGRVKGLRNVECLARNITETKIPAGLSQKIGSLTLFESKITHQGPTYTELHTTSE
ncbi:MAG: RNA 2',3'-cyclic phosphodiesterase [Candidatus Omnitrophica bacterium]|nr:RNA 2',3'-cyclic phosphodiesterase [Candidatus Omnitrophota bacterium]